MPDKFSQFVQDCASHGVHFKGYTGYSEAWIAFRMAEQAESDLLEIRERVFKSLDSGIENGYELDNWSAEEIAEDLREYDVDLESVPVSLVPFIQEWKDGRIKKVHDLRS